MKVIFFKGYSVDEQGVIYNSKGEILKTHENKHGYKNLAICTAEGTKNFLVHRVIASAFIPNPLNKPFVNHKDGNKQNNSINNLEWVTHRENCIHAIEEKLYKKINILNTKESIEIISMYNKGALDIEKTTVDYNISYSQLYNLLFESKTKEHLKEFVLRSKPEYSGPVVSFSSLETRNMFIINEYIPGKFGNYESVCKKFGIKKSMLYNIVKTVEKNKISDIVETLSEFDKITVNEICYTALKHKVSANHVRNILTAKAKV